MFTPESRKAVTSEKPAHHSRKVITGPPAPLLLPRGGEVIRELGIKPPLGEVWWGPCAPLRILVVAVAARVGLRVNRVEGHLLCLRVAQQRRVAAALAAGVVDGVLRREHDAEALDAVLGVVVLGVVHACRRERHLERAQSVNLHALRVAQLALHHVHHLRQHGQHVGLLGGGVLLDCLSHAAQVHRISVDGSSVVLAEHLRLLHVVLVQTIENTHSHKYLKG